MIKAGYLSILAGFLYSCNPNTEIITIKERALIPEGIAIGDGGEIYLSNIYAKNITRSQPDGSQTEVIKTKYTDEFSGVGITQKNGKLFQLGNNDEQSVFQIIDIATGNLLESYVIADSVPLFFNDLAVAKDEKVYITDSNQSRIFTVRNDSIVVFLASDEIQYPNGIALSDDERLLVIASFTKGIRIYNLATKEFINKADTSKLTTAIDGLKFHRNSLIGIQNASRNLEDHSVVRFFLNKETNGFVRLDTLFVNHPAFNIPTTFDIKDGWLYCLANSQMENLNQETMELINVDELTDTFILKHKLE